MLKILIADDHAIVRKGITRILLDEFSFATIEEAEDSDSLINKALAEHWDIVISDLSMPGVGGLEAVKLIVAQVPHLPVLIISFHPEEHFALPVIRAGAAGYLNKDTAAEQLILAVQRILSGKKYITDEVAEKLSSSLHNKATGPLHEFLSEREMHVFKMLAGGVSIIDIASRLGLGATTVSTYRTRILSKMDMTTNADLTQYAMTHQLI